MEKKMQNESRSLYEKAVAFINELSKKTDFSLVNKLYMLKETKLKLNEVPAVFAIGSLFAGENAKNLTYVNIGYSGHDGNAILIKDEDGSVILKEPLARRVPENLNLLLIKYKMPHAAYPSYFLIENSFDGKA